MAETAEALSERRRRRDMRWRRPRTEAAGPIDLTAEADDEAILDMIALEMAADDPSDVDDVADMETG